MTDAFPFDEEDVPKPNPEVDVDSLSDPPSADDFFLFERVDGSTSVGELCTVSGLGRDDTLESLERLRKTGLVEIPGVDLPESGGKPPEPESETSTGAAGADAEVESEDESDAGIDLSHLPIPPSDYEYDEDLLRADVSLDATMKRELMCLAGQLESLDYYEFFGVDRDASRNAIKMAYFKLSKRYHPDRHFDDEIGPFEEMLEEIFQTITRGYRVLSDADKRAEYDEELAEREAEGATPMNRPSSVRMADEREEVEEGGKKRGDWSRKESAKRRAAYEQLVRKAEKHRKAGEPIEAADAYRKALAFRRELDVALRAARVLLGADEELEQAELFARAAMKVEESTIEGRMLLGKALEKQGRTSEALEVYEDVLEFEPDHDKAKSRRDRLRRLES